MCEVRKMVRIMAMDTTQSIGFVGVKSLWVLGCRQGRFVRKNTERGGESVF